THRLREPQARTAVRLVEEQHLARINEVRVADLVEVHAPELRPAPWSLEVQPRYGPQGVARLDGVRVRRVRQDLRERHAGFGHALRGAALLGGDGPRDRLHGRSDTDGADGERGGDASGD